MRRMAGDGIGGRAAAAGRALARTAARAARLALALAALGPFVGAQATRVARVELAAPAHTPFLLRATVPVPKGVFPREDGRSPLTVGGHDASAPRVRAQVEVVSRYPTGEADVVEVIARVDRPPEAHENSRIAYSVFLEPGDAAREPALPPSVGALLARVPSGRVSLRTRDVHGNLYVADLSGDPQDPSYGSHRVLKSGPWRRERRVHATLVPRGGPSADGTPLAHLMGVHAYLRETAGEELVGLDLRVHNGAVSPLSLRERAEAERAGPHPLETTSGLVYWTSLELVLPKGWTAVPEVRDPFFGAPYAEGETTVVPIVAPRPDGKLHVMGPQMQFERRLALVPEGGEERAEDELAFEGLGFCVRGDDLWSWYEPTTARYFPQRDLLASVDFYARGDKRGKAAVRMREAGELAAFRAALETGGVKGYYVHSGVMGWAHPWFICWAGGVGGEGIATFEGYWTAAAGSREGYAKLALMHRMNVCRQPEAAYDRFGDPVGYHAWLGRDGRIPFDFRLNGGILMPPFLLPAAHGPEASPQVRAVVERGLRPPYDLGTPYERGGEVPQRPENLFAWWPHDDQHMVRYTKQPKALVWLGNDAMAKDDLLLSGELFRLVFHESEHAEASWSKGTTLRVWREIAAAHPHQGGWIGREHAWGIDSMCAAYSVASPEWRARQRPWFDHVADLFLALAQPSGLIQRFVNPQVLGHTKYTTTQAFESLFLIHSMRCLNESVFRGTDDGRREALEGLALRAIDYLYWGPPWAKHQSEWQPDPKHPTLFFQGPRWGIAVSPNDDYASPPFSDEERWGKGYLPGDGLGGGVEFFHPWAALSFAEEITRATHGAGLENKYLKRSLACGEARPDWASKIRWLAEQSANDSLDNSANWIGYLGKLQALGVR